MYIRVSEEALRFGIPLCTQCNKGCDPKEKIVFVCSSFERKNDTVPTKEDMWEHRATGMICKTCMYFVKKVGKIENFGRCRKHSPTMSGYPAVYGNDWCGDHKLNENI